MPLDPFFSSSHRNVYRHSEEMVEFDKLPLPERADQIQRLRAAKSRGERIPESDFRKLRHWKFIQHCKSAHSRAMVMQRGQSNIRPTVMVMGGFNSL